MTGQPHTQATQIGINSAPRGFRLGLILLDLLLLLLVFQRLGLILQGCLGLSLHGFHGLHHPCALRRLVLSIGPLAPCLHRLLLLLLLLAYNEV